jgi:hypothetical protein
MNLRAMAPVLAAIFVTADAARAERGVTEALPCTACHTTDGWRSKAEGTARFDHATTGFPLTGQHVQTPCVGCHDSKRTVKRACASCHADAHRGRLSTGCDGCHVPAGWRMTKPLEIHRFTRLPLTGMHVLADCTQCHRRANDHQWTGAPVDCFACHEKDYRRPDLRPVHTGSATSPAFPRNCSQCHTPMAWVPARFDPAQLTGSTHVALRTAPPGHDLRFPLSFGIHRGATCEDCHLQSAAPRMVRCDGCHAHDPIRLAAQHKQPVARSGAACLSCHPGGARR